MALNYVAVVQVYIILSKQSLPDDRTSVYYCISFDAAGKFKHFKCSYQEGLKQSKVLQEEKQEEENAAEKLLESKNKDEESGKNRNTSR